MLGIDLQAAVEAKMASNEARVYRRQPNGTHLEIGTDPADAAAAEREAEAGP